jgi:putative transposase
MARPSRLIIPGAPHHIVHKGNNGTPIFEDDFDRFSYLSLLKERSDRCELVIHGYCLMLNHIHLVATPVRAKSVQDAIGMAHNLHSKRFNRRHGRVGHLWQSRYYSCPLDEPHFLRSLVYVDKNPVRAGLVENPFEYPWSSAAFHYGTQIKDPADLVDPGSWLVISEEYGFLKLAWDDLENYADVLRRHLTLGKPLGDKDYFQRLASPIPDPVPCQAL